jgi:TPR repeat protein
MKLKRAIAAIVLASAFAAPVAAGTFEDAVDAHARGDYAKALRLIRPLANDGNATAQFNLGVMYLTGHGVRQDYSAAALWFRKAAEQGYALAQSNLGTLYRDGRGVAQDDTEAVIWFRKAADQGDAVAEFLLGNQYANGKGVPQDYREAMIWFGRAAEQDHPIGVRTRLEAGYAATSSLAERVSICFRTWQLMTAAAVSTNEKTIAARLAPLGTVGHIGS